VSHLVLDIGTHGPDIALWPGSSLPPLGIGLYSGAPAAAFVVELLYGILCWWVYRGSAPLLLVLVAGNLANASFFFAGLPGPEQLMAGRPILLVTAILTQIVVMLLLVWRFAAQRAVDGRTNSTARRAAMPPSTQATVDVDGPLPTT
jgi:hypothetical protein